MIRMPRAARLSAMSSYGGLDFTNLHVETVEHLLYLLLVGLQFPLVDIRFAVVLVGFQKIERRVLVGKERLFRVEGSVDGVVAVHPFAVGMGLLGANAILKRTFLSTLWGADASEILFLVFRLHDIHPTVVVEFHFLWLRVIVDGRNALTVFLTIACSRTAIFSLISDNQRDTVQKLRGVKDMLHSIDGLCTEIYQECQCHQEQQSNQAGSSRNILDEVGDVEPMVAPGIEDGVGEEWGEKLRERHRTPYHNHCQGEEPFHQVEVVVCPGEFQSDEDDEQGDGISGNAKTA